MPIRDDEGALYPSLSYDDAPSAIDFLVRAFGFERRFVAPGPDGTVAHAELSFGSGVVFVATSKPERRWLSPRKVGAVTQSLSVRVADPDAHYARAKAAGANIVRALEDEEHGSRGYLVEDPEGHQWYFGTYRPGAYWGGA